MSIVIPRMLALDTATLGAMSKSHRSSDPNARDRVQRCVHDLAQRNYFIALSWTQTAELFRHENDDVFYDRFTFLGSLPHIAWVRPYHRYWYPGSPVDVLLRELHSFKYNGKRSWPAIVSDVRAEIWETGNGSEMFGSNLPFWEVMRAEYQYEQRREATLASLCRVDHGVNSIKLSDVKHQQMEDHANWPRKTKWLGTQIHRQIREHGDPRIENAARVSAHFAADTFRELESIRSGNSDLIDGIVESCGVPRSAISAEHTIGDLGDLAVYARRLRMFCKRLQPPCAADISEVPISSLPSYDLQRRLSTIQNCAARVSGSDIGDSYVACLAFYSDVTEVDKRTFEYVGRVGRGYPAVRELLGPMVKSGPFETLLRRIEERIAA